MKKIISILLISFLFVLKLACAAPQEQQLPASGSVNSYTSADRIAPFEIKAAQGNNYFVKLVNAYSEETVLTVFVRGGTTVNIDVPLGTYKVKYASGSTWYGENYLFGTYTSYSKTDKMFDFKIVGNQVSGFSMTLYTVANGNLHMSKIPKSDF